MKRLQNRPISTATFFAVSTAALALTVLTPRATHAEVPGTLSTPGGTALVDIPVAIQVTGSYSQISQFFSELESLPRAILAPKQRGEAACSVT